MTVANALETRHLTDARVAAALCVSREAVRLWRRDARRISPRNAKKLAELYGIPRHELRPDLWERPDPRQRAA